MPGTEPAKSPAIREWGAEQNHSWGEHVDDTIAARQIKPSDGTGGLGIPWIQRNRWTVGARISALEFLAVPAVLWLEPRLARAVVDRSILGGGDCDLRASGQAPVFSSKDAITGFQHPTSSSRYPETALRPRGNLARGVHGLAPGPSDLSRWLRNGSTR